MRKMSPKRQMVLDLIKEYTKLYGVPPSYEVIAKALGLKAKSNIHRIVHRLEEDGFLRTKPYKFRSIVLIDSSVKAMSRL